MSVSGAGNHEQGHVLVGSIGAADAGLNITVRDGSTVLGTTASDAQGHFSFAFQDTMTGAVHSSHLTASATDAAGNAGTSNNFTFAFDYTPNQSLFGTVAHDTASHAGQIYALYDGLLGRAPDPIGGSGWLDALDRGVSLHDVTQALLTSSEGLAHLNAIDNAGFIAQLYDTVLGRSGDPVGVAGWTAYLNGGGDRVTLADNFVFSSENVGQLQPALQAGVFVSDQSDANVARLYYGLLGRAPDGAGLQGWDTAAHQGTSLQSIAQGFLTSAEYTSGHGNDTDQQFLDHLYANALGRPVDTIGQQGWLSALSSGTTRADVALGIAESPEAQIHLVSLIEQGWHLA